MELESFGFFTESQIYKVVRDHKKFKILKSGRVSQYVK